MRSVDRPRPLGPWRVGRWLAILAALGLVGAAGAEREPLRGTLDARVREARRVARDVGVHVVDLGDGATVYGYQPDTLRIIASNAKLVTTAAALDRLGPGFFFETPVLIRGEVADGVLQGDVAVVGAGDPNLSGRRELGDALAAMRRWGEALEALGVHRVAGDFLLVHGLFDEQWIHPDWPADQLTRWYEAPVSALSFSDNCVLVEAEGRGRPGSPAAVRTVPPLALFTLESTARTGGRGSSSWLSVARKPRSNVLTVNGRASLRGDPEAEWVSVADPLQYFGAAMRHAFAEAGVAHGGAIVASPTLTRAGWRTLLVERSDLLSTLEVTNKRSQNFYADSLIKLLGARLCGEGSWTAGVRAVEDVLTQMGIERGTYRLADGSGMSRNNHLSPRQLTRLLAYMFHHRYGAEFVATLPYSGEPELRWEKRLAEEPYRGNVFAKTGTLNGVSTLSGYAKSRSGRVYAFSILLNRVKSSWEGRTAQDKIVRAVVDHG